MEYLDCAGFKLSILDNLILFFGLVHEFYSKFYIITYTEMRNLSNCLFWNNIKFYCTEYLHIHEDSQSLGFEHVYFILTWSMVHTNLLSSNLNSATMSKGYLKSARKIIATLHIFEIVS